MDLKLTAARVREELFTGGFRPMERMDFYGYGDAEPGSLIADEVKVGRFAYQIIFSPSVGDVQIFAIDDEQSFAWQMDLLSGEVLPI